MWPRWRQPAYRERAMQSLDWLQAQGKRMKGHNLAWPAWKFSPADIAADPDRGTKIAGLVDTHIRDITAATKGRLIGWDVVNEPINETEYFKHMPREQVAQWFKLAEASDPKLQLTLNEYAMLNRSSSPLMIADMLEFARMLKAQGARVDVLGVQGHVGQTGRAPASVLTDLDLLASEGHQIQITEFDMNSPDEQLQAEYTRDFLIALYSHKAVTGFIMWGFWESEHWKPNAAMFRPDWSPKANLKVWEDLVLGAWRTRLDGVASAQGEVAGKGHHGRYRVKAMLGGQQVSSEFDLKAGGGTVVLQIKP
jgi:endo-1,4-beta-xylanase